MARISTTVVSRSRISATGTDTYVYDDADKLMSVTRGAATTQYTYDNCGRPTNIGGRTLTWDYEDRMTTYSGNSQAASYGYNGAGSRVSKSGTGGARTYKRDGVGVTAPVLSDGVATMVPGISEKSGGVTSTILSDRLGSMKGMSNAGAVTETAEFDAFGKVIARTNPSATQKGFAGGHGYQEDGESGYKLLGHRYYDAETGRFLSRDRAKDGRNWYVYCDNNPLNAIDANGLAKVYLCFKSVGKSNGYHAFILVYDEVTNTMYYYRGGIGHRVGYNYIEFEHGEYKKGTTDYMEPDDGDWENTTLIIDDDKPASYYDAIFIKRGNEIKNGDAKYILGPFNVIGGGNSNSLARELLEAAGLPIPKSNELPVWAPWWDSKLGPKPKPVKRGGHRKVTDKESLAAGG